MKLRRVHLRHLLMVASSLWHRLGLRVLASGLVLKFGYLPPMFSKMGNSVLIATELSKTMLGTSVYKRKLGGNLTIT